MTVLTKTTSKIHKWTFYSHAQHKQRCREEEARLGEVNSVFIKGNIARIIRVDSVIFIEFVKQVSVSWHTFIRGLICCSYDDKYQFQKMISKSHLRVSSY